MRKLSLPILLAVLAVGACSPSGVEEESPTTAQTTVAVPEPDPEEEPATTEPSDSPEGPPAPDFALELATGETFRLSEEQDPVYLVFWAEW